MRGGRHRSSSELDHYLSGRLLLKVTACSGDHRTMTLFDVDLTRFRIHTDIDIIMHGIATSVI